MTFVNDERVRRLGSLVAKPVLIADRFELGSVLGEGGMGVVYEAWDCEGERSVALKVLHRSTEPLGSAGGLDEAQAARFEREAYSLARICHPGVVQYITHGVSAEGDRYLAMGLLAGETLAERLASGPLSVKDAMLVGQGIATALAAVHEHALVHRDIKPDNLLLQDGEVSRVVLLDFGLVRAPDARSVTRTGSLVGTPSYMAPEQVRAESPPDARSDLFALGSVLFECLTGRAAFTSDDTESLLMKVLVERPAPVRELCPNVPVALDALVSQLLEADPSMRPASAAETATLLGRLLHEESKDGETRAASTDCAAPKTLIAGKYRVERELGRGGMGVVLLAHHEALDRHVALKLLKGDKHDAPERAVARLAREARATSALASEHVARVMDVDTHDDGSPFIVMEYLRGKDLGQLLAERGRLPFSEGVAYVLQATEALAEAHSLGIVHRDLKPSNLFLTARKDGTPLIKVLDFGISKLTEVNINEPSGPWLRDGSITAPDAVLGSPLYMSPEQLQNTKHVDARTDIWSIGVVLFQLLTGRLPFEADSILALGAKIAAGTPTDVWKECPDVPIGLTEVVLRCLAKAPADRFANMIELALALSPYAPHNVPSSRQSANAPSPAVHSTPALVNGWRWATTAMVGAAALAVGTLTISKCSPENNTAVSDIGQASSIATLTLPESSSTVAASSFSSDLASRPPAAQSGPPPLLNAQPLSSLMPSSLQPPRVRIPSRPVPSEVAGQGKRGSRVAPASPSAPPPSNVLDPMNPALLDR